MQEKNSEAQEKKEYNFGGIQEFDLEKIEAEVLNESMYLEVFAGSDIRFKKNINPINNVLDKLLRLEGVTFDWKTEEFKDRGFTNENQVGFLAQDVKAQFPQLVKPDSDGYLTVNYSKMVPLLLEGMREMAQTMTEQGMVIEALHNKIKSMEAKPATHAQVCN